MIDAHQARPRRSGARIVHACGFDSIPSDLGVWFTQQRAIERLGAPCERVTCGSTRMKGGASGGTIAVMVNLVEEAANGPGAAQAPRRPLRAQPGRTCAPGPARPTPCARRGTTGDRATGWRRSSWRRSTRGWCSAATPCSGRPWGQDFRYDEAMDMGPGPLGAAKAAGLAAGLGAGMGLMALGPTRRLAGRVLPKPGEGPEPGGPARGVLRPPLHRDHRRRRPHPHPGHRRPRPRLRRHRAGCWARPPSACSTSAGDEVAGGFWTPSTALGDRLVERLEAHAGMRFDVLDWRGAVPSEATYLPGRNRTSVLPSYGYTSARTTRLSRTVATIEAITMAFPGDDDPDPTSLHTRGGSCSSAPRPLRDPLRTTVRGNRPDTDRHVEQHGQRHRQDKRDDEPLHRTRIPWDTVPSGPGPW